MEGKLRGGLGNMLFRRGMLIIFAVGLVVGLAIMGRLAWVGYLEGSVNERAVETLVGSVRYTLIPEIREHDEGMDEILKKGFVYTRRLFEEAGRRERAREVALCTISHYARSRWSHNRQHSVWEDLEFAVQLHGIPEYEEICGPLYEVLNQPLQTGPLNKF